MNKNIDYLTKLAELKNDLTTFFKNLINIAEVDEIRFIGLGNNITAGFNFENSSFSPPLYNLAQCVLEECYQRDVNVTFFNMPLFNMKNNEELDRFIHTNPTSAICKNMILEKINPKYKNSLLSQDSSVFSSNINLPLDKMYNNKVLTITTINCCNGIIKIPNFYLQKKKKELLQMELIYLQCIINYIINMSSQSFVCINNLPHDTENKHHFDTYNKNIADVVLKNDRTCFIDNINATFSKEKQLSKISFYQTIEQQYQSLYIFAVHLMKVLPKLMIENSINQNQVLTPEYIDMIEKKYRLLNVK